MDGDKIKTEEEILIEIELCEKRLEKVKTFPSAYAFWEVYIQALKWVLEEGEPRVKYERKGEKITQ